MYTDTSKKVGGNMKRALLILCLLASVGITILFGRLADFQIPDKVPFATAEQVIEIHSVMSDAQLESYSKLRFWDMIFPLAYGGTLLLATSLLAGRLQFSSGIHRLLLAPAVITIISDYLENSLLISILASWPETAWPVSVVGYFGGIKTIAISLSMLIVLLLLLRQLQLFIRTRCVRCAP